MKRFNHRTARSAVTPRAFTLLEVMISIAVLAALTGTIFTFLYTLSDRRDAILRDSARLEAGSAFIDRLERELSTALAGTARDGVGIRGDATSLTLLYRGVRFDLNDSDDPSDLQTATYAFRPESGRITTSRGAVSVPQENNDDRFSSNGEEDNAVSQESDTLLEGVERLRFRYFEGRSWTSSFDSGERNALPVAIEVAIWYRREGGLDRDEPDAAEERPSREPEGMLDEYGRMFEDDATEDDEARAVTRGPDRRRMIVIPDGPNAAWSVSR